MSRVLHTLGYPVLALATQGGRTGAEFAADLVLSGIPHELVAQLAPTRRTVTIVDETLAESTLLAEPGNLLSATDREQLVTAAIRFAEQANVVVFSGSLPPGFSDYDVRAFVAAIVALDRPIIVDTSGSALLAAAQAGATLLKPNREELLAATGETDVLRAARQLCELGAQIVVFSNGSDGMGLVCRDSMDKYILHARLAKSLRGNATGAGDAAVAAFATALVVNPSLHVEPYRQDRIDAIRLATAWSASAVLMPLAGELSEQWQQLLSQVVVSEG